MMKMIQSRNLFLRNKIVFCIVSGWIFLAAGVLTAQIPTEKTDFLYGERLYKEKLFDMARIQFENFVTHYSDSPKAAEAQFLAANCYFFLDKFQEAQEAFIKLMLRYPSSSFAPQAQFGLGQCFEKMGKSSEAIESYYRVFSFYPESPNAMESLYHSGRLSVGIGNLDKAESFLQLLLEWSSAGTYRSKASFLLADIYSKKGENERAVRILEQLQIKPADEETKTKALFQLGQVYEKAGLLSESREQYQKLVGLPQGTEWKQRAWFRLGCLYEMEGEGTRALDAFQKVLASAQDDSLTARAQFCIGKIKVREGDFQAASLAFDATENRGTHPAEKLEARFEKALCLKNMGKASQAVSELEFLLNDSSASDCLLKKSLLTLAHLFVGLNENEQASGCYDTYLRRFKKDPLESWALLKKGKIYIQKLNFFDEGFQILRSIWQDFPTSGAVPEARFVYAEGLEKIERMNEALEIYRTIGRLNPGTLWANRAEERIREIETFYPANALKGFSKLAELTQKSLTGYDKVEILRELGDISFQEFKQYEEAIGYFKKYIAGKPEPAQNDAVLLKIAKCYEALYLKNKEKVFLDSAQTMYSTLSADHPNTLQIALFDFRLAQQKAEVLSRSQMMDCLALLDTCSDNEGKDELLFRMGTALVQTDSLKQGLRIFGRLLENFPDSPFFEEALFNVGKIHFRTENLIEADSIFALYSEKFSKGRFQPESDFYRAKVAVKKKDHAAAVPLLETLCRRFSFSPWADSGCIALGELYLETNDFSKAIALYTSALEKDSLQTWSASVGLQPVSASNRKRLLFGLARAYQGSREYLNAKKVSYHYGQEYREAEDQVRVFSALSRIAEEEGNALQALDYMNRIFEKAPSDSTVESLGQLFLRLNRYEEAATAFEQALRLNPPDEKGIFFSAHIIVCLVRQEKIPQAEVRMEVFEQSFKKDPRYKDFWAEFVFEKGMAYLSKKDFPLALSSMEEVVQKYKGTRFVPEAEFEIGRIYLITNRVEEALKILTEMPNRYPDHPIVAKVYLNLGDHYFRSQQYENAMRAFTLAMENKMAPDIVPVAMRYLIRVYDALRLWDVALGLTREYIQRFPKAEDILQKRVQIGTFYMSLNEYSRAVEYLREVKKDADSETEAEIQYWIGKCYANMGRFEEAIFEFLKVNYLSAPTRLPWNTTALYEAGLAYVKLQKPEQAKTLFQKIVQKEGATSDLGRIARQRIQEIDAQEGKKE